MSYVFLLFLWNCGGDGTPTAPTPTPTPVATSITLSVASLSFASPGVTSQLSAWEGLLEGAKAKDVLHHENRQPNTRSYFWAPTGTPGTGWTYHTWVNGKSAVNLYINTGDRHEPKRIFDLLYADRSEIESAFGEPLQWERLDEKNASRIQHKFNGSFQSPEDDWPEIQDELINCMDRLVASIGPHLSKV